MFTNYGNKLNDHSKYWMLNECFKVYMTYFIVLHSATISLPLAQCSHKRIKCKCRKVWQRNFLKAHTISKKRKRTKQGKPDLNRNKRGPKKLKVTDQTHEGLVSPVSNAQAGSENNQESQMLIESSFPAKTAEHGEEQNSRGEWNSFQNDDVVNDEINERGEGRGDEMFSKHFHKDDGKLQQENPRDGQIGDDELSDESSSQSYATPAEVLPVALNTKMQYEDEMENEEQGGDDEMCEEISDENEENTGPEESDEGKMPGTYDDEGENLVEESDEEDSQESDDFAFAENLLS